MAWSLLVELGQKTMALGLKECFLALDVALAIFDKQGLFSEEGLLSSLRVSDKLETIRLPLKGFQVKQLIFLWSESQGMSALCSLCLGIQSPDMWNLVSLGIAYTTSFPFIPRPLNASGNARKKRL